MIIKNWRAAVASELGVHISFIPYLTEHMDLKTFGT